MRLTIQTDYALRILMFAAGNGGRRFSVEEVARVFDISRNHAMKIVQRLANAGYLRSYRGRSGGLTIGQAPETVPLGALVRFLEEDFALVRCQAADGQCPIDRDCGLRGALEGALEAFFTALDRHTLASVALGPRQWSLLARAGLAAGAGDAPPPAG